jgi:hypothetical protein
MSVSISTGNWILANAGIMLVGILALTIALGFFAIAFSMAIRNRAPLHEQVFWAAEPTEEELDQPTARGVQPPSEAP